VFPAGLSNARLPHAPRASQFALFLTVGLPSPALDAVRRGGLSPLAPRAPAGPSPRFDPARCHPFGLERAAGLWRL